MQQPRLAVVAAAAVEEVLTTASMEVLLVALAALASVVKYRFTTNVGASK
jgi:hypothetical protein